MNNEWISLKERLPEIGQDVLVFDGKTVVSAQIKEISPSIQWTIPDGIVGGKGDLWLEDEEVTHWMPYPLPPY